MEALGVEMAGTVAVAVGTEVVEVGTVAVGAGMEAVAVVWGSTWAFQLVLV
jgi:hypothetical protein